MDAVAQWSAADRRDLFSQCAAELGFGNALIVEKDFWVCWAIRHAVHLQGQPRLIFKGGTSLSKVFGLIRRFSEDIDLAFHRHDLGFAGDRDPATPGLSGKRRAALVEELEAAARRHIETVFLPALTVRFEAGLAARSSLALDPGSADTIIFEYPHALEDAVYGPGYVRPQVRLEMGGKSDHDPQVAGRLQPYAATVFPDQFSTPQVEVPTLDPARTFWEKVTLLHERISRGKAAGPRISRHIYDVVELARAEAGQAAMSDLDLLKRVREHKAVFFKVGGGVYEAAKPGTLKLVPPADVWPALRTDYSRMSEMFFESPPNFDTLMDGLEVLESRLNAG